LHGVFGNVFHSADPAIIGTSNKLLFIGGNGMTLETHVDVIIWHEDMETLEITMQEVREIIAFMTNVKRKFKVSVGRTAGTDENGNNVMGYPERE
jgi:hypothetical protein